MVAGAPPPRRGRSPRRQPRPGSDGSAQVAPSALAISAKASRSAGERAGASCSRKRAASGARRPQGDDIGRAPGRFDRFRCCSGGFGRSGRARGHRRTGHLRTREQHRVRLALRPCGRCERDRRTPEHRRLRLAGDMARHGSLDELLLGIRGCSDTHGWGRRGGQGLLVPDGILRAAIPFGTHPSGRVLRRVR